MLQIIENPRVDDSIFLDMMRSRISGISPSLCLKFAQMISQKNYALASGQKLSYSDVFLHLENYNEYFSQEELQKLETFWNTILKLQVYASEHHILRLLQKLLKDFGMIEFLEEQKLHEAIDDVYSFYTKMQSLSEFNPQMKLQDFLAKLDLYRVYGFQVSREILSGKKQSVEILTAHGSKGLEYSHVFIPGMHAGNWEGKMIRELIKLPENLSGEGLQYQEYADMSEKEKKDFLKNRQLEEDRRLFFVALTRAKKHVTLSFSAQSDGKLRIVSPFISEIGEYESVSEAISAQEIQDLETQELSLKEALYEYDEEILTKIQENLKNYKLSVSDLNTFLISPRDFLRSSLLKYPFMQTESAVFGTMIHRSLELFYKKMQETGKIQDEGYLLFVYEKQLEKELLTHEERERLKKRGKEALSGYYKTYNGNFVTPLKTEYRFSRKNIFFEGIPLTGVMDKIELLSDEFVPDMGNGSLFTQAVKITDYKTGSVKYMGEIK